MFQALWKDSERRTTWIVLLLLIIVAILSIALSGYAHIRSGNTNYWEWLDSAAQNFSTEMLGAILTFALFELILGSQKEKREKAEQIAELQKRLVHEAGSQSNETAKAAVDYLRAEGWLTTEDSLALLKEANLKNANLQQADLSQANLQQADLSQANLQVANLAFVDLQQGNLLDTNLQRANLYRANLLGAKYIETALFDSKTVLPDASIMRNENGSSLTDEKGEFIFDKYWTPETDMSRFTDLEHPNFWVVRYGDHWRFGKQAED